MFCHCFSFIFICYDINTLRFMSFVFFETHIFGDNNTLQLPLHCCKLIINGQYLSSAGFKSVTVGQIIHGLSFNDKYLVRSCATELLKLNNSINTCSMKVKTLFL